MRVRACVCGVCVSLCVLARRHLSKSLLREVRRASLWGSMGWHVVGWAVRADRGEGRGGGNGESGSIRLEHPDLLVSPRGDRGPPSLAQGSGLVSEVVVGWWSWRKSLSDGGPRTLGRHKFRTPVGLTRRLAGLTVALVGTCRPPPGAAENLLGGGNRDIASWVSLLCNRGQGRRPTT